MEINSSSVRSDMVAACKGYAAPMGLGNLVARVATKISLLTELRTGAPKGYALAAQLYDCSANCTC